MNDNIIKRVARVPDSDAPSFETVLASPPYRRMRKLRAGLVAVLIVTAVAAPFVLREPPDDAQMALLTPPTTDWLLETPDPHWLAQLDRATPQNTEEEPSHVH